MVFQILDHILMSLLFFYYFQQVQRQQTDDVKLESAEQNLPEEKTEFLSTHSQMLSLEDIGKF